MEAEIDRIDSNTSFAGTALFDGSSNVFQVGAKMVQYHTPFSNNCKHGIVSKNRSNDTNGSTSDGEVDADITTQANGTVNYY